MKTLIPAFAVIFLFCLFHNELLAQKTDLTIFVREASNLTPIKDAEISYFDKAGRKIPAGSTNSNGYLRVEVPFGPGAEVVIQVSQPGIYETTQTRWLIKQSVLGPNTINFYLRVFQGLKVTGRVYDNKSKASIWGATITVPDPTGGKETYKTGYGGFFEFNSLFSSGEKLPIRIEATDYYLLKNSVTLELEGPGNNEFDFYLDPVPKINWCNCFLYGSAGAGIISLGSYVIAGIKYDKYKDFNIQDRETKYNSANTFNRVSIVSAVAAVGLLTTGWICKKKENKTKLERSHTLFAPLPEQGENAIQLGVAYHF